MKNIRIIIIVLAVLKFVLPFILQNGSYQPHRDEYLYLDQANHLDWGYLENPPLITALAYLTKLMGSGMGAIKFWPALFGVFTFCLTAEIAIAFGGKTYSVFLVFLAFTVTSFFRIHFLLQPNFLDIFFSTAMALSLLKYVQTEKNYWLYIFGISAGFGIMGNYSAGFYLVALLLGLLMSKQVKIYLNFHLYISLILAACLIAPNYYWQYMHNFPVLNLLQDIKESPLHDQSAGQFISDQFTILLPCFYLWVMGILYLVLTKKGLTNYIFLLTSYLLLIIFLMTVHGKGYYALNAFPALLGIGAYNFERLTNRYIKVLRYILITFSAFFGLFISGLAIPFLPPEPLADLYQSKQIVASGVLRWDDQQNHPLPQDFSDMLGWFEITERTFRIYSTFTDDVKAHTLIYTDNLGVAGGLNYFGKSKGLPFAFFTKGSYVFWMPDTVDAKAIILLTHEIPKEDDPIYKHFKTGSQMDDITIPFVRESRLKIMLYTVPDGQQNDAIKQENSLYKKSFYRK